MITLISSSECKSSNISAKAAAEFLMQDDKQFNKEFEKEMQEAESNLLMDIE
jgi:hypothetical protein